MRKLIYLKDTQDLRDKVKVILPEVQYAGTKRGQKGKISDTPIELCS